MKELLNKKRSKVATNRDNYVPVELSNEMKKIANHTDQHLVDVYQVYLDEKDASDKYRLIFTINPVCSNVLFNAITEVVKDEGSNDCEVVPEEWTDEPDKDKYKNIISDEPITRVQCLRDTEYSNDRIVGYTYLPGIDIFNNHLMRQNGFNCVMKRDKSAGGEVTGATFMLTEKFEFEKKKDVKDVFNTIRDYQRTVAGRAITKKFPGKDSTYLSPITGQPHLYEESEILDFESAFKDRLKEVNGWFGFYNPSTLDIPVAKYVDDEGKVDNNIDIYVNKLINNKNACDFIDMFPDRKRFTFVPQKNKFQNNRLEKNWDYCLTYPYAGTEYLIDENGEPVIESGSAVYNPIVSELDSSGETRNGLMFTVIEEIVTDSDRRRVLIQSTGSVHNLKPNSVINLSYKSNNEGIYDSGGTFHDILNVAVKGIGDKNGEMQQYFFTIDSDDVPNWFDEEGKLMVGRDKNGNVREIKGRFARTVFGIECRYYFRVFRRLPNFNSISKDEDRAYYIGKYNKSEYDFNSEINKLAFSNNIYGDNLVQIVYLDDIDVNGLTDNYERPVSDIYLTIVKTNKGHELWYPESGDAQYNKSEIEISRCFGKVTSGIDLPPEDNFIRDYNVHRIHNVDFAKICELTDDELDSGYTRPYENLGNLDKNYNYVSGTSETSEATNKRCLDVFENLKTLEDDITIDREFFLGDLVEFSLAEYNEVILEPVYHRFNTAQREYVNPKYKDIVIDEIYMDDYEGSESTLTNQEESIQGNFKCVETTYNRGYENHVDLENGVNEKVLISYPGNIFPEGYYYQPHYRIHLKDVSDKISQSSNTFIAVKGDETETASTSASFTTVNDEDIIKNDEIVIQDPLNNVFYDAVVTDVTGVTGETRVEVSLKDGKRLNLGVTKTPDHFIFFKKTLGIPKYAINYPDTNGKYIWRPLVPHSKVKTDSEIYDKPFANGAHYRHIGINFFLKRQDPYGYYELNTKIETSTGETNKLNNFMYTGRSNESIYYNDAIDFGLIDIC